jgi:spore photoproduct lyase
MRRVEAAAALAEAGYEVRVRIDPMVPVEGWEEAYRRLVDAVFARFRPSRVTLGSLRGLRGTISFAEDKTWVEYLGEEETGWGRKVPEDVRLRMYRAVMDYLADRYGYRSVALCKETEAAWRALGLDPGGYPRWEGCRCNCVW